MTFDEYWKKFNEACPLDISDEEIIRYIWEEATAQAAMTGIELEQYIQEKWTAGYEEGFKQGRSTVMPEGYALVPLEPTEEMIEATSYVLPDDSMREAYKQMVEEAQENKNV